MPGRQRFTFIDATVEGELVSASGGPGGGSGGGGGMPDYAAQLTDIFNELRFHGSALDSLDITSQNQLIGFTDQLSVCILTLESIDTKIDMLGRGGGMNPTPTPGVPTADPVVKIDSPYVALNPVQFRTLLDAIRDGKSPNQPGRKPPVVNPPKTDVQDLYDKAKQFKAEGLGLTNPKGIVGGMAGGKVGGVIGAADMIAEQLVKPIQFARTAVMGLGEAAQKLARNDGIGVMTQGLDAASAALGKIPVVGKVFAAGLDLASGALQAFKGALDSFAARGRELAQYNPRIALAAATADVRKIFADIREANQMGSRYADLILKQQEVDEKLQKALMPLKMALADLTLKMVPIVEWIARQIPGGGGQKTPEEQTKELLEQMNDNQLAMAKEQSAHLENISKLVEEEVKKRNQNQVLEDSFFKNIESALASMRPERGFDPVNPNGNNGLRIPMW